MIIPKYIIFFFILSFSFAACQNSFVFEQEFEVPDKIWKSDQAVRFETEIQDTASIYNLYIKISNTEFYPNSNLWLFTKTIAPNQKAQIDTVELFLADQTGKWFGKESDGLWSGYYPFKTDVRFPQKGKYSFQLVQGMRTNALEDVQTVGIAIEKVK